MKLIYLLLLICCTCVCRAQTGTAKAADHDSDIVFYPAYYIRQFDISEPPYGLEKVKTLISKINLHKNYRWMLDSAAYETLTLREKFTYHLIHPESYSQICARFGEDGDQENKIFCQLPFTLEGFSWGKRQYAFLTVNRDTVIALLKECIGTAKIARLNFKRVIVYTKAKEMIPLLISTYNADKKDHYLLTVLMLMMKEYNYVAFASSPIYHALYGEKSSYKASINYSKQNEVCILKLATDFYNAQHI